MALRLSLIRSVRASARLLAERLALEPDVDRSKNRNDLGLVNGMFLDLTVQDEDDISFTALHRRDAADGCERLVGRTFGLECVGGLE